MVSKRTGGRNAAILLGGRLLKIFLVVLASVLLKVTRYLLVLSLNLETFLAPWLIVNSKGVRPPSKPGVTVGEEVPWS